MLERYYLKPETIDRIRATWLGEPIERYVAWLTEQGYAARSVCRRVPMLMPKVKSSGSAFIRVMLNGSDMEALLT